MIDGLVGRGYQPALTAVPEPARGAVILAGALRLGRRIMRDARRSIRRGPEPSQAARSPRAFYGLEVA